MKKENQAQENGLKALKNVKKVLTDIGWDPEPTDIEGVLRIDFSKDKIPVLDALADVRIEYERFLYYLNFRDFAAPKYRKETMEFITRINFDLITGNFEINLDNGSVRYKSSIDFTQVELTKTLIGNIIKSSRDVVEQYGDALIEVMHGKKKAAQAIDDVEGNSL